MQELHPDSTPGLHGAPERRQERRDNLHVAGPRRGQLPGPLPGHAVARGTVRRCWPTTAEVVCALRHRAYPLCQRQRRRPAGWDVERTR
jgi:hypothetical protein